jgi:hypothetical protein
MSQELKRIHRQWLGYLQPEGLVVTATTLASGLEGLREAEDAREAQVELARLVSYTDEGDVELGWDGFLAFARTCLEWEDADLLLGEDVGSELDVSVFEGQDLLRPDGALTWYDPDGREPTHAALIGRVKSGQDPDRVERDLGWEASPHARFERLLKETGVPVGVLVHDAAIRLVFAPRGESTGWMEFPHDFMLTTDGRVVLQGMMTLLHADVLYLAPAGECLVDLMRRSREHQAEVSDELAGQVLEALYVLLGGVEVAHRDSGGELLESALANDPQVVYGGLLAVLLRLVFVLYAEERGLFPDDPLYLQNYSIHGLFEELREDASEHPDTMGQRYGAWARLLTVFRLVFDGAAWGEGRMPPRQGKLFDPDEYAFLEGRMEGTAKASAQIERVPAVSDEVVYEVLTRLLLLDGEALSYRALDVEQIGSVYEYMMGFELLVAPERMLGLKLGKVAVFVGLDSVMREKPGKRKGWIKDHTGLDLKSSKPAKELKAARNVEEAIEALSSRVHERLAPDVVPKGSLVLQPGEDRRKSGSHYTPRALTEPIVRRTLEPVIEQLGPNPTPQALLGLRVCDPAMGSGAFLVEATRFLADRLVEAWTAHDEVPEVPSDEEPVVYARRVVAQRCIYGVDKNPFAVDLAKLSLWLFTMARDHPFTFVDHALRWGDSLVGLSVAQIKGLTWESGAQAQLTLSSFALEKLIAAKTLRTQILDEAFSDDVRSIEHKRGLLSKAEEHLESLRLIGDLTVRAFFTGSKSKERRENLAALDTRIGTWVVGGSGQDELELDRGYFVQEHFRPFHWELEFPEALEQGRGGFDAFVGNPPFAGKNTIAASSGREYLSWIAESFEDSHGNSDLVAYFFRNTFEMLRPEGTLGLIATNTIYQGDTRTTGLKYIRQHGGKLYQADKRVPWPGLAAVIVSVVHICKTNSWKGTYWLDGRSVPNITSFLFHGGGDEEPLPLRDNESMSFQGSIVLGMGFTFDDTSDKASSLAEMRRLIQTNPSNQERIFPYIGGRELNDSPTHEHHRYVINFEDMSEQDARRWPDLMSIVEERVKPDRDGLKDNADGKRRKAYWWQFGRYTPSLFESIRTCTRVLANSQVSTHMSFAFQPNDRIFANTLYIYPLSTHTDFTILQSRIHEVFAKFFSSSMKDDMRYTPSSCFEPFPAPTTWNEPHELLEDIGKRYYEYRANLMVERDEGMTKTYNRFHDPTCNDPDIVQLRALHQEMDEAVLAAYGWDDVDTTCEWRALYEVEEGKKIPWRWQWSEATHDDVLARLIALNEERKAAEEEGDDG